MNGRDGKGWNDCYKRQEISLACVKYLVSFIVHLNLSTCICTHLVTSHGHVVIISQVIPEMRCDQCKLFLCVIVLEMQFINLENYPPYGINHSNGAVFN